MNASDVRRSAGSFVHRIMSRRRALHLVDLFSGGKVLVAGDVMLDHFIVGRVSRISPEAPVPVVEVAEDELLMGGCSNVLNNIHAMGGKGYGAGVIGDDPAGRHLLEAFSLRGMDHGGLVVERSRPTTLKTRVIAHRQQVLRYDRESRKPIDAASRDAILGYIESLCPDLGAIVVSDYGKGVVSPDLLQGMRRVLGGSSVVVCVDPKQSDFSLYRGFDIITPNHHEACRALGREVTNGEDIVEIGWEIVRAYDIRALLITRGEEGMSLFERETGTHILFPTKAREVYDVTGAGDTVIGIFALAVAVGANFREAAVLANAAAGIVVGKVGTATVEPRELKGVL